MPRRRLSTEEIHTCDSCTASVSAILKFPRFSGQSAAWVDLMRHARGPFHISPAKYS